MENTLQIVASPENVETLDKLRMFLYMIWNREFLLSGSSCPMVMMQATHTCSFRLKRIK